MNKINKQHLSSSDLAKRWRVSIQTIYNWITSGAALPKSIKIGGIRRWDLADVEVWEEKQKEETKVVS